MILRESSLELHEHVSSEVGVEARSSIRGDRSAAGAHRTSSRGAGELGK
jgi:hypothetical protein